MFLEHKHAAIRQGPGSSDYSFVLSQGHVKTPIQKSDIETCFLFWLRTPDEINEFLSCSWVSTWKQETKKLVQFLIQEFSRSISFEKMSQSYKGKGDWKPSSAGEAQVKDNWVSWGFPWQQAEMLTKQNELKSGLSVNLILLRVTWLSLFEIIFWQVVQHTKF